MRFQLRRFALAPGSLFDGLVFDPFALKQDGLTASEVDVGRGEVLQALMVAVVIVVIDEAIDLRFELAGEVVVLEQDAVVAVRRQRSTRLVSG